MALVTEFLSTHLHEARCLALGQGHLAQATKGQKLWNALCQGCRSLFQISPFYFLTLSRFSALGRQTPRALRGVPSNSWPGDSRRGAAILSHEFPFAGHIVVGDETIWRSQTATQAWRENLHAFEWLDDLHVIGSDAARLRARSLITSWIGHHGHGSHLAWRSDITGRRICAWLGRHEFFCASADNGFKHRVYASLARQLRHLAHREGLDVIGVRRIEAIKGMIHGGLYLPGFDTISERGLALLEREMAVQILPDGGQAERSPVRHLAALRHIIDIRASLLACHRPIPPSLQGAIDRMAPMLRFFRHGDGRLAGFNGGSAPKWLIDMVLNRSEARGKALNSAPHSGFQRLQANRTLVLLDSGPPTLCQESDNACAGTLSFEMSVGREAMIVNCGRGRPDSAAWQQALRCTAAHSSLTLDGVNSSDILDDGRLGRRVAAVHCLRNEEDGNIWIDASHDGYQADYGVRHLRRLYLVRQGDDLRGEDSLIFCQYDPQNLKGTRHFAVRFHLHPSVRASLVHNRRTVLIKLPSGQGWRFHADGGITDLEESIFVETDGTMRRSEQIVLSGRLTRSGAVARWALQKAA